MAGGTNSLFLKSKEIDGKKYHYFLTELHWRGHGHRYFSLFRWMLFPVFLIQLIILIKKEKPNCVLAVFPDGYYILASWIISRLLKLKMFTYFHNTYTENRYGFSKWFATKIQSLVFRDSILIFTMSEGMNDYYKEHYPEFSLKFKVLPHTFDKYPEQQLDESAIHRKAPYRLVMMGSFNDSNIESTIRLLNLISKYPSEYQVEMYTPTHKQILKFKWGLDLDALGVHYKGYVREEQLNEAISNCDVCLLTHGFSGGYTADEYKTIFPTRMIPLMLSGRPMLVHSPEGSFLNAFIKKYDCAELVSATSDSDLLNALKKVTTDKQRIQTLIANAKKASSNFYGPDVYRTLMNLISGVN